jgi:hypothetical protein
MDKRGKIMLQSYSLDKLKEVEQEIKNLLKVMEVSGFIKLTLNRALTDVRNEIQNRLTG